MNDLLPPTFAGLTEKQIGFIRHFVETGGRDASLAARLAGYSTKSDGHRVIAHRLLRDSRILSALRHEIETRVKAGAALAMGTLLELAEKASTDGVRFQAAQAVLDRAGLLVSKTSEHTITIKDERTTREILENIRELAASNGIDPIKLLGLSEPLDVEFEEVSAMSSDGVEDLLS